VKQDDPQLTVREVETTRQPLRVVVDSRLEISPAARIVGTGTLIATAVRDEAREAALTAHGASVALLPNIAGRVSLPDLLRALAACDVNELHVEAGAGLNGSLLQEGLVDELLIYLAPHIMGDKARGMFDVPALTELAQRREFDITEVRMIGSDLRVIARMR